MDRDATNRMVRRLGRTSAWRIAAAARIMVIAEVHVRDTTIHPSSGVTPAAARHLPKAS
jgi:hypothetical protein